MKKNKSRFLLQAEGFALSTPTNPFLKGLIPKSMNLFQEKVSTHAGVWAVFKPRGGCLKISFAPTDKPLKRLDLNFSTPLHEKHWIPTDFSFPVRYTGICTGEKEVAGCKVNPRRFTPMFCSCSISC